MPEVVSDLLYEQEDALFAPTGAWIFKFYKGLLLKILEILVFLVPRTVDDDLLRRSTRRTKFLEVVFDEHRIGGSGEYGNCGDNDIHLGHKSSQVNTLPKAKSKAKDKRAKDRQQYAALRCKVGVAPSDFEVRRRMSRVAFRVFPAGRQQRILPRGVGRHVRTQRGALRPRARRDQRCNPKSPLGELFSTDSMLNHTREQKLGQRPALQPG
jgi:hypothetical protein